MTETSDPASLQRDIERTRAELADTVDAIADRLSPKRAASRGASAVKAQVGAVFDRGDGGDAPAGALEVSQGSVLQQQLRTDRVAMAAAAVVGVVALVVWRRSRS